MIIIFYFAIIIINVYEDEFKFRKVKAIALFKFMKFLESQLAYYKYIIHSGRYIIQKLIFTRMDLLVAMKYIIKLTL